MKTIIFLLIFSTSAYAGQFGLGIETNETGTLSTIVAQSWFNNLGLSLGYSETKAEVSGTTPYESRWIEKSAYIKYAFHEDKTGKLFGGLKLAEMETKVNDTKIKTITYGPILGCEYPYGLYWWFGYVWIRDKESGIDIEIEGTQGALGFVYYFN